LHCNDNANLKGKTLKSHDNANLKGKTLKSHYNANLKGKTSKIPRQCKFKRKNANIKGKTLKCHDNLSCYICVLPFKFALSWHFSVFPFIFAFFLLNLHCRGIFGVFPFKFAL
jgi:hypothetical protein